jgi:hypothetical protein
MASRMKWAGRKKKNWHLKKTFFANGFSLKTVTKKEYKKTLFPSCFRVIIVNKTLFPNGLQ